MNGQPSDSPVLLVDVFFSVVDTHFLITVFINNIRTLCVLLGGNRFPRRDGDKLRRQGTKVVIQGML